MRVFSRGITRRRSCARGVVQARQQVKRAAYFSVQTLESRVMLAAFPQVFGINRMAPTTTVTGASTLFYSVTFNESVSGVDATDFQVVTSGSAAVAPIPVAVSGTGGAYMVSITGVHGNGTVQLELVDNDSIVDGGAVALGGAGARNGSFDGQSFTILQTFPTVTAINRTNPSGPIATGNTVLYTVTFSTPVIGVDASDFSLALGNGATTTTPVTVNPPSGSVYQVTVNGVRGPAGGIGTLGLNLVDNGTIRDATGNPLQAAGPVSSILQPQQTYSVGASPHWIESWDLNRDGIADLVVSNRGTATAGVLLGNGNGTFGAQTTFAVGAGLRQISVADVNGDGIPDLLSANQAPAGTVSVLLGNGNGTFQPQTTFAAGPQAFSLAATDLNGDGRPDLVVANDVAAPATVSVLMGNGNGTFAPATSFSTGGYSVSLAAGDFNGDGKMDVLVTNANPGNLSLLLGNGNGTFQPQQTIASGVNPHSIAVGDLNGDGNTDAVIGNYSSNNIGVLLGNGNGTFVAQVTYASPAGPHGVAITDMNGDGKEDLVVAALPGNATGVMLGNGDGTFGAMQTFVTASGPASATILDANRDGRPDVGTANFNSATAGVFINASAGNFVGQVYQLQTTYPTVVSINRSNPVGPVTSASSVNYTVTFSAPVTGVDATDFTLSLTTGVTANFPVVVTPVSGSVYTVTVNNIVGAGILGLNLVDDGSIRDGVGDPLQNVAPSFLFRTTFAAGNSHTRSTAVADMNGDGKQDIIVTSTGLSGTSMVSVLLGNGDGTFRPEITTAATGPTELVVGDMNADGIPDVAVANSNGAGTTVGVLLGNGNGTLAPQKTYTVNIQAWDVTLGDANGDGKPDLLTANTGGSVSVLAGNGDGTFQPQVTSSATPLQPNSLAVGDINGDGKLDAAIGNANSNTLGLVLGNGNGTFAALQTIASVIASPWFVRFADLDGDGKLDLVYNSYSGASVGAMLGNGNGTFKAPSTAATLNNPDTIAPADINGDGIIDLVVSNRFATTVSVLLGNGNGTFLPQRTFTSTGLNQGVSIGDFNGDGRPDITVDGFYTSVNVIIATGGTFTGQSYTIAPPVVTSITRSSPTAAVTGSNTLVYAVNFSAPVTNVTAADFKVVTTGSVTATLPVVVSGSGTSYTVTINGVHGNGTIQLNLVDRDTIVDALGTPVGSFGLSNGSFSGPIYSILQTFPTVLSITQANPIVSHIPGGTPSVTYAVTFSTAVTGVDASDFLVSTGGAVGYSLPVVVAPVTSSLYNVTINGITGTGHLNLTVFDQGSIRDVNQNPLQQGPDQAGKFQGIQTFAANTGNTYSIAPGDVNGDGKVDLATAGASYQEVGALLGNGLGGFVAQQTYATGVGGADSVVLGDINGDGAPDMVVATLNNVGVLLGNGNGTFAAQRTFISGGSGPVWVALSDFNGDGKPDVVAVNEFSDNVGILLGNGNGTFAFPPKVFAAGSASNDPRSVAVADFNGDGIADLVTANYASNTISVLLGNGNGSFAAQQTFSTGANSGPVGVQAGDVNADGIPDVAVGNWKLNSVGVLLANGNGTFGAIQTIAVGVQPDQVQIGDLNGDGRQDLFVIQKGQRALGVLLGNANGTFLPQITIAAPNSSTSVVLADVNGDLRPDAVVGSLGANWVTVYPGYLLSTFIGTPYVIYAVVTSINRSIPNSAVTGASSVSFAVNFTGPSVSGVDASDFRVITGGSAAYTGPVVVTGSNATYSVTVNGVHGNGALQLNLVDDDSVTGFSSLKLGDAGLYNGSFTGQTYTILQPFPTVTSINRSSPAGPGIPLGTPNVTFAVNFSTPVTGVDATDFQAVATGGVTFTSPVVVSGSGSSYSVTVNGIGGTTGTLGLNLLDDGTIRDSLGNPLQVNPSGVAAFSAPQTFAGSPGTYFTTTADLNADGKTDVVVTNYTAGGVGIYLGNGNGTFAPQLTYATGASADCVTTTDVNGDGIPDLVVANWNGLTLSILLGNGNGTFLPQTTIATPPKPFSVVATDINGDGRPDLLVDNEYANSIGVMLGNGNGTFAAPVTYATGHAPFTVATGDFNADGSPDIVVTNASSNYVSIFLNNGNGTFQPQQTFATDAKPYSVDVADVNGDGKVDVMTANEHANSVGILLGNGNGTFAAQTTLAVGASPVTVVAADENGDGVLDLVVANVSDNTLSILVGNGNGTFNSQQTFAAGPTSYHVAAGDFNRDGRLDFVVADFTGPYVALITNTGNGASTGQVYTVANLGASKLAFSNAPSDTVAGSVIDGATGITVAVQDSTGTTVTSDSSTVTLTLSSGTFSTGSNTATAQAVNGIATFSNLVINSVGPYTLTATDGTLTSIASATFNITKATPTVAVTDSGGTYNTNPFPATATVAGFGAASTPSASLEGVAPTLAYYAGTFTTVASLSGQTPLAGAPSAAGAYTVLATFAGSSDYTSASALANFTIAKATPTVLVTDGGGTYARAAFPATASVAGVGSQSGSGPTLEATGLTISYYAGTFTTVASLSGQTPLPGAPADAGSYTAAATFPGSADYLGATALTNFTINKRSISANVTAFPKTYDQTTSATATVTVTPLSGDSLSAGYITASFSDKNAANNKTVTVTGITLTGPGAANYSLSSTTATTTANINPRPLNVTATAQDKNFDGGTAATVALSDNRLPGDVFSDFYAAANFSDPSPGAAKTVTVTGIFLTGPDAANYAPNSSATATASILLNSLTVGVIASFPSGFGPQSGVILDSSGNLFGTLNGGNGSIFKVTNGQVSTIGTLNGTTGSGPKGRLLVDASGNLYGVASSGGSNNLGTIFKWSGGTVTALASFKGANGASPAGGLVMDAAGNLYGVASSGGANGQGCVFELPVGQSTITALASFNFTNGSNPLGALVFDSAGNLYGTAQSGGASSAGTVFELAGGASTITVLANLSNSTGANPESGLVIDGQGNLYGVAPVGGTNSKGTVFELPSGSNTAVALANFDGASGAAPFGALLMDAGGNLFGASSSGGATNFGGVFEIPKATGSLALLASFNGTNGSSPAAALVLDGNGNFFLATRTGGTAGGGGSLVRLTPPVLSSFRGSPGNDSIALGLDSDHTHLHWQINNDAGVMTASDAVGLFATGLGGNDTITLDYTFGNPLPANLHLEGTFTIVGAQGTDPFAGTTIDLGHSTLFVQYPGLSSDPINSIKAYIARGYASGAWTGTASPSAGAIYSAAAQTNPLHNTAIGYADWDDGTGVNTTPNTVEIKYTLNGDTNLNGSVDIFDLNNLLPHYNKTGIWDGGDFTYNGAVDIFDLNALLPNYNKSLGAQVTPANAGPSGAGVGPGASSSAELTTAAAVSAATSAPGAPPSPETGAGGSGDIFGVTPVEKSPPHKRRTRTVGKSRIVER